MRGRPVPLVGSIVGRGRRRAASISKDKEEPQTGSIWPFPAHKPRGKDFKEMHSRRKFRCSKCLRKYKTKSNMVKHENKCTLTPRLPAHKINYPRSDWRPYTHEPGDDSGKARSISHGCEEDPATSLREEADDPYDGPPVDNGRYETPPDVPEEEDKSGRMNVGR